ncbi:MAG: transcriptional regulator [Stenotrophomonas acidaminiphila]|nr:MAG: transcriptional regulator [Stenotrophomonas acidaminiphila]
MSSSMSVRILSARVDASLSQSQLATHLGINRSAVAQWERVDGGTNPSIVHLTQIADITGVGFEWLATGRGVARARQRRARPTSPTEQASNEFEAQCLQWLRRVPAHKQALVIQLLSELARSR